LESDQGFHFEGSINRTPFSTYGVRTTIEDRTCQISVSSLEKFKLLHKNIFGQDFLQEEFCTV